MSWTTLLALAAAAYAMKAVGPVVVGNRRLPPEARPRLRRRSSC